MVTIDSNCNGSLVIRPQKLTHEVPLKIRVTVVFSVPLPLPLLDRVAVCETGEESGVERLTLYTLLLGSLTFCMHFLHAYVPLTFSSPNNILIGHPVDAY